MALSEVRREGLVRTAWASALFALLIALTRFASKWDNLRPWQRGVLGVAILVVATAMIFAMAAAYILTVGAA